MMKTCVAAVAVAAACAASAANYAKLDASGTFKFYSNETCTAATEVSGTLGTNTSVMFSSDAEFKALVPYTNVIAAVGAKVVLQNDIVLTTNVDWRAFDFNINGKTVTLDGWDCRVGRVQGTNGTFAAGNLVTNGDFEADKKNLWWKTPTGWTIAEKSRSGVLNYRANGKDNNGEYKLVSQLLNPTNDISYWAVLYTPKVSDDYTQTAAFQQTVTVSRGNWEYFVSFRYMTSGYNGSNGLVTYTPENSRIIVSLGDTRIAAQSCTTNIQTFARTLKDDNALPAGTDTLKFTLYSAEAGACFDDVVVSPLSRLYFDIPPGVSYDARNLTLKDQGLQVHKTGDGTITMSRENTGFGFTNPPNNYTGGLTTFVVEEGCAKQGVAGACGAPYSQIEVQSGGQFDLNGVRYSDYDFSIAGKGPDSAAVKGALVNTKEYDNAWTHDNKVGILRNLAIDEDATVGASGRFGMVWYNNKEHECRIAGGKTLVYTGKGSRNRIFGGLMNYTGAGTIVIAADGDFQTTSTSPKAPDCELVVYGQFGHQSGKILSPLKSLIFKNRGQFFLHDSKDGVTIVYQTYAPNTVAAKESKAPHPLVQLGDAEHLDVTLDLSEWDVAFDDSAQGTLTFYNAGDESEKEVAVTVELNQKWARRRGQPVYKWQSRPANVHFVRGESMAAADIQLYARDDGLYIVPGLSVIIR